MSGVYDRDTLVLKAGTTEVQQIGLTLIVGDVKIWFGLKVSFFLVNLFVRLNDPAMCPGRMGILKPFSVVDPGISSCGLLLSRMACADASFVP